jgi:hypothetical protein
MRDLQLRTVVICSGGSSVVDAFKCGAQIQPGAGVPSLTCLPPERDGGKGRARSDETSTSGCCWSAEEWGPGDSAGRLGYFVGRLNLKTWPAVRSRRC